MSRELERAMAVSPREQAATAAVDFGYWPGRIVFGIGAVGQIADVVGSVGGTRALVICGSTVALT